MNDLRQAEETMDEHSEWWESKGTYRENENENEKEEHSEWWESKGTYRENENENEKNTMNEALLPNTSTLTEDECPHSSANRERIKTQEK